MRTTNKLACVLFSAIALLTCYGCNRKSDSIPQPDIPNDSIPSHDLPDLEHTVITQHTPESNTWNILQFHAPCISSDSFDIMQETAMAYHGSSLSKDKILCDVWSFDANHDIVRDDIPLSDMDEDRFATAHSMRFSDDDLYLEYSFTGRMELYNRKSVRDLLDVNWEGTWGWRPSFSGHKKKSYHFDSDHYPDDTYQLDGSQVSIATALQYADSFLNGGTLSNICTKYCTYQPVSAEVYSFDNGNCGYVFTYQLHMDGVPIDICQANAIDEGDNLVSNTLEIMMASDHSIDWLWSCGLNSDTADQEETCTLKFTYEDACNIISEDFSQGQVFCVKDVELLYCAIEKRDSSIPSTQIGILGLQIEPMWQFHITNPLLSGYHTLYINVSAVDGKVYTRYE